MGVASSFTVAHFLDKQVLLMKVHFSTKMLPIGMNFMQIWYQMGYYKGQSARK